MTMSSDSVMTIFCSQCQSDVEAVLTNGEEIYPHRPDLYNLPFWKCESCQNYVGCHHKTNTPMKPLGNIPTPELRKARVKLHGLLDSIWKSGKMTRSEVYTKLSEDIGRTFHVGETRSLDEIDRAIHILLRIVK